MISVSLAAGFSPPEERPHVLGSVRLWSPPRLLGDRTLTYELSASYFSCVLGSLLQCKGVLVNDPTGELFLGKSTGLQEGQSFCTFYPVLGSDLSSAHIEQTQLAPLTMSIQASPVPGGLCGEGSDRDM